jgi:hypothetical protein
MSRDPPACFVELYHEFGPVFRTRLPGRDITVLAGCTNKLSSNRFAPSHHRLVFVGLLS